MVLGATGVMGNQVISFLKNIPGREVLIAGRSKAKLDDVVKKQKLKYQSKSRFHYAVISFDDEEGLKKLINLSKVLICILSLIILQARLY